MGVLGFKTQAVKEAEAKALLENNNSPLEQGEEMISVPPVVAETFDRLETLNNVIVGEEFSKMNPQQRQMILSDFAYLSQVAAIL